LLATGQSSTNGSESTTDSSTAVLADGTPVRMRMGRTVSSVDARPGDVVNLEVLDEIKVDNTVVLSKGAAGLATVTSAEPKKTMGRGGKLEISIDSVSLANGQKATLRAVKRSGGPGNQTSIVSALATGSMPSAPLIFVRGKDVIVPQGTEFTAYVNGDVPLELSTLQPGSMEAKSAAILANSATELLVSSFPDLAEIQIDGKFVGTTPGDVIVRSGQHHIVVRLAGFKIWRRTIDASGEKLSFKIRLEQDGLNGSTVSNCSGPDCSDIPLGDVARQKKIGQRNAMAPR